MNDSGEESDNKPSKEQSIRSWNVVDKDGYSVVKVLNGRSTSSKDGANKDVDTDGPREDTDGPREDTGANKDVDTDGPREDTGANTEDSRANTEDSRAENESNRGKRNLIQEYSMDNSKSFSQNDTIQGSPVVKSTLGPSVPETSLDRKDVHKQSQTGNRIPYKASRRSIKYNPKKRNSKFEDEDTMKEKRLSKDSYGSRRTLSDVGIKFDDGQSITTEDSSTCFEAPQKRSFWRWLNFILSESFENSRTTEIIGKRYNNRSFFVFSKNFFLRRRAIQLISSHSFERVILFIILLNILFLSLYNPMNQHDTRNEILHISEIVFQAIFSLEIALKVFAQGLILHKHSFLRDAWNCFDVVIVGGGFLGFLNFNILRSFKLLHPLKSMAGMEEMRKVINTLFRSLPILANALIVSLFFWWIYGVMGTQLFQGMFRRRCFHQLTGKISDQDLYCGSCPDGYVCLAKGKNPNNGITSFDNTPLSTFLVFTMSSVEGWTSIQDVAFATSNYVVSVVYFSLMVIFGSYFIGNLSIAVISEVYARNEELENVSSNRLSLNRNGFFLKMIAFLQKCYSIHLKVTSKIPLHKKIQRLTRSLVTSSYFVGLFLLLTLANTVVLGMEHYNMPRWLQETILYSNYSFIILFWLEMILKLYGLGIIAYFSDNYNTFDAITVTISIVEISIGRGGSLSLLRTVRLLKIFKYLTLFPSMQRLLKVVIMSIRGTLALILLFVLMNMIFALLGMQLFGGQFVEGSELPSKVKYPPWNFDNLFSALLTTFILATGQNWNDILHDSIAATNPFYAAYFVSWFFIANVLLLNLILVIMIAQFRKIDQNVNQQGRVKEVFKSIVYFWKVRERKIISEPLLLEINSTIQYELSWNSRLTTDAATLNENDHVPRPYRSQSEANFFKPMKKKFKKPFFHRLKDRIFGDYVLFLIPDSLFRRCFRKIVSHKIFDGIILVLIIISAVMLAIDHPYSLPDSSSQKVIVWFNYVLTGLFSLECLLKIFAFGLFFMQGSYLRSWWNVLDFLIVFFNILSFIFRDDTLLVLRTFRLLRILRPLRFIKRIPGLRIVVGTLLNSIGPMLTVAFFSLIIFLLFGVMGVQLFSGQMRLCTDQRWSNKQLCLAAGEQWENTSIFHFDHLFSATITLIIMSTKEGFVDIMYRYIDSFQVDYAPIPNSRPYVALYFIAFVIVGCIFLPNLYIGVLVDNYNSLISGEMRALLTSDQKRWVRVQQVVLDNRPLYIPKPPKRFFPQIRNFLYRVTSHGLFEMLIVIIIFLNLIVFSMEHYNQPQEFSMILKILGYIFVTIFTVECVLKIIAFDPIGYFKDILNIFDFSIVILSLIGIGLSETPFAITYTSVFRIVRIVRIFRITHLAPGIRKLMKTLFLSLPSLVNVSMLLFLLYFMFGILGMHLFSRLSFSNVTNEYQNFRHFRSVLVLLFRVTSGENFHLLMEEISQTDECSEKRGNCNNSLIGIFYFLTFILLSYYVLVNLFIAVILENFLQLSTNTDISEDIIQQFVHCWMRYDPTMSLYMDCCQLPSFLAEIGEPLGTKNHTPKHLRHVLNSIELVEIDGKVHYHDVLIKLCRYRYGVSLPPEVDGRFEKQWNKVLPHSKNDRHSIQRIFAAIRLQRHWRFYAVQKALRRKEEWMKRKRAHIQDIDTFSDAITYDSEEFDPSEASDSCLSEGIVLD